MVTAEDQRIAEDNHKDVVDRLNVAEKGHNDYVQKRIHDYMISQLVDLYEKMKAAAWDTAKVFIAQGGDRDDLPSSVAVTLAAADRVFAIAEREAGHSMKMEAKL